MTFLGYKILQIYFFHAFNDKKIIIIPSFPPARGWGMPVVGVFAFAVEIAGFSIVNDIKLFPFHFNLRAKYTEMC